MNDAELTELAAQQLLKEAERFKNRQAAQFQATKMRMPMKTNKRFLNNTIKSILSYNNSIGPVSQNSSTNPNQKVKFVSESEKHTSEGTRTEASTKPRKFHQPNKLLPGVKNNRERPSIKISLSQNAQNNQGCEPIIIEID